MQLSGGQQRRHLGSTLGIGGDIGQQSAGQFLLEPGAEVLDQCGFIHR